MQHFARLKALDRLARLRGLHVEPFIPRDYQLPLMNYLDEGGKRAVAVWHRRAGKDRTAIEIIKKAAQRRPGLYWHLLPSGVQGRRVVWDGINRDGNRVLDAFGNWRTPGASGLVRHIRNDEMKLVLNVDSGEAMYQVVGADSFNNLMGANPVGVVLSEWSLTNPFAWEYIRPILAENGGWALFIYTPRSRNHGWKTFQMASNNPDWFCERLTVDDTHAISPEAIEEEREAGMPEELIQQEFWCSFEASIKGSYYGAIIAQLERDGRIGDVPYDPRASVTTGWDLGFNDMTVVWFAQLVGDVPHIIDYYANFGKPLDHYLKLVAEKPYTYHQHLVPHDGKKGELIAGTTIESQMREKLGASTVEILAREKRLEDEEGINAVRSLLPRCRFDAVKCEAGLDALRMYRQEWNDALNAPTGRPLHDWASDPADGFRALATGLRPKRERRKGASRRHEQGSWMG